MKNLVGADQIRNSRKVNLLRTPGALRRTLRRSRGYISRLVALRFVDDAEIAPTAAPVDGELDAVRDDAARRARATDPAPSRDIPPIPRAPRAVQIPVYGPGADAERADDDRVTRLGERVDVLAERIELLRQRLENQALRLEDSHPLERQSYVSTEVRALAGRVAALEARLALGPAQSVRDEIDEVYRPRNNSMVAPRRHKADPRDDKADPRDDRAVVSGVFPELSLTTLLSLFELERSEGVLSVESAGQRLEVELRGGVAARSFLNARRMPLVAAVREALTWETGRFEFHKTAVSDTDADEPRSVNAVVLEASHLSDEAREAY